MQSTLDSHCRSYTQIFQKADMTRGHQEKLDSLELSYQIRPPACVASSPGLLNRDQDGGFPWLSHIKSCQHSG